MPLITTLLRIRLSRKPTHLGLCGLALLAEEWGDPSNAHQLNWDYIVKKRLGETFPWRSETERKAFYSERNLVILSYERYIQQNKRS